MIVDNALLRAHLNMSVNRFKERYTPCKGKTELTLNSLYSDTHENVLKKRSNTLSNIAPIFFDLNLGLFRAIKISNAMI